MQCSIHCRGAHPWQRSLSDTNSTLEALAALEPNKVHVYHMHRSGTSLVGVTS
jgi:hypothetical protein